MKPSERIDYLINVLEGGNAQAFSNKTGIYKSKVSDLRHKDEGIKHASYYGRILSAYPKVNREWLYYGEGKPTTEYTIADYAEENARLWSLVSQMQKNLAQYCEIIERYEKTLSKKKE